ncbi:MAG: FkbM family methyltransferase [Opitutales bacterium]|tara:strand:- start:10 stop:774 length:765 start_codon:yes stop_codon:yes gene_type:complete
MIKSIIKSALKRQGYQISPYSEPPAAGSDKRAAGNMESFLEDIRARGLKPKHILDVGAASGNWCRMAQRVFPEAGFTLIEPRAEESDALTLFCDTYPQSRVVTAGAGSKPGELPLTIGEDPEGSSFFIDETEAKRYGLQQRVVPIVTIDSLFQTNEYPIPELVKLDVQGSELDALCGAQCLFPNTEIFILECSLFEPKPNYSTVMRTMTFMEKQGYALYDVAGFLRRPRDGALAQMDLVFAKEQGMFRTSHAWV